MSGIEMTIQRPTPGARDAAIESLCARWRGLDHEWRAAYDAYEAAEGAARAEYATPDPRVAEAEKTLHLAGLAFDCVGNLLREKRDAGKPLGEWEAAYIAGGAGAAEERRNAHVAKMLAREHPGETAESIAVAVKREEERVAAAKAAAHKKHRVDELDAVAEAIADKMNAVTAMVAETPADTVRGVALKFRLANESGGHDDLEASAHSDLYRLAGLPPLADDDESEAA